MTNYVKHLSVTGLYGRFDLEQSFHPGVNVLYGQRGKTTLLHILGNLLNGDLARFEHLEFETVCLELGDGQVITVEKGKSYQNIEPPIMKTAYFPAFREMIEAWSAVEVNENFSMPALDDFRQRKWDLIFDKILPSGKIPEYKRQEFARELWGQFVPTIEYASIYRMQTTIIQQIQRAEKILTPVLKHKLSRKDLAIPDLVSAKLDSFRRSVNKFFQDKELVLQFAQPNRYALFDLILDSSLHPLNWRYTDSEEIHNLYTLSASERHVVTLLYAAGWFSDSVLILIDEPELSLPITWQRKLLPEMSMLTPSKQIIACTQSPVIGANHDNESMELVLTRTQQPVPVALAA